MAIDIAADSIGACHAASVRNPRIDARIGAIPSMKAAAAVRAGEKCGLWVHIRLGIGGESCHDCSPVTLLVPVQTGAPSLFVSSLLFGLGLLAVLVGLYLWARRRSDSIRQQAAQREQAAMAMMLGSSAGGAKAAAAPAAPAEEVDHAALIRQAHAAAEKAEEDAASKELPPIEYDQRRSEPTRPMTPAEEAAAGLDPIEELISQIMVDDGGRRAVAARVSPPPPPEPRRAPAAVRAAARESTPMLDSMAPSVPLRELVLAWYESRGYRQVPASPAVWPIELVLRHRDDPARAYAFVVQNDNVSVDRITALIEQAREIGMLRVAVIAEAGYERGAKEIARRKNVRLIDRPTMDAELSDLQLETAAKIIAVARKRASPEASAA
jgi:hypothetical protein